MRLMNKKLDTYNIILQPYDFMKDEFWSKVSKPQRVLNKKTNKYYNITDDFSAHS